MSNLVNINKQRDSSLLLCILSHFAKQKSHSTDTQLIDFFCLFYVFNDTVNPVV